MELECEEVAQPYAQFTFLLKFDSNQEYAREVDLVEYQVQKSGKVNDVPLGKTILLRRLPPWTDPDSIKNLLQRMSGGVAIKVYSKYTTNRW